MFYLTPNGNHRTQKQRETIRVFAPPVPTQSETIELEKRIASLTSTIDVLNHHIQQVYVAFAKNNQKIPADIEALLKKCKQPALFLIVDSRGNIKTELPIHEPAFIQPLQEFINDLNRLQQRAKSEFSQLNLQIHLDPIISVYTTYVYEWERSDNNKRRNLLIPTPELCCESGEYYRPSLTTCLQILSRNQDGERRKENELGNRPVFAGPNRVHYKAQPERDFIKPGSEKFASETYNDYCPGLAAPSQLLKLTFPKRVILKEHQVTDVNKHNYELFLQEQKKYRDIDTLLAQCPAIANNIVISYVPFSDCAQASLTIEGILFLDILLAKATLDTLSKRLKPRRLSLLLDVLKRKAEQLKSTPLPPDYTLEKVKQDYEIFFNTLSDGEKPINCSQALFERTFNQHRDDGVKKLYDTLQLLKLEGMAALMPGLKLADLIQLPKQLHYLSRLWPVSTSAEKLERLSHFFSYWNIDNAQGQMCANLALFPTDWKADNIMVAWATDEKGNLKEWRIVGIDNDNVLPKMAVKRKGNSEKNTYHSIEVKCIPFCIPELLDQEILPTTRQLLSRKTPAQELVARIKAAYEQNFRYKRMTRTGVLVDTDLTERDDVDNNHQQKLDVPVKLNLQAMLAYYQRLQRLYTAGQSPSTKKLSDIFIQVDPIIAAVHQLAIRTTSNPIDAFLKVGVTSLEDTFGNDLDQNQLRAQLQALAIPKQDQQLPVNEELSPEELIVALVHHLANQTPTIPGQLPPVFEILSAVATQFATVELNLKLPKETLNKWLILAAQQREHLDPNLILFLIDQGADPTVRDEAKRTLFHMALKEWSKDHSQEELLTQLHLAGINSQVNAIDDQQLPPLFYLIDWAHRDIIKATRLLQILLKMGLDIDAFDPTTHESALDKAIKRDKPETFIMLVEAGAGRQVDARKASAFIRKYQNDPKWKDKFQNALTKLDHQNPSVAFITDIENYTQATPPTPQEIQAAFEIEKKRVLDKQLAQQKEQEKQLATTTVNGKAEKSEKTKKKDKIEEVLSLPSDYPYLIVGALSDKRFLRPVVAIQLYNKMVAPKVHSDSQYGNATAFCVELNGRKLWFKLFPELAGTEETNNVLSQMLKFHCVVPSELFRFLDINDKQKPCSVLISKDPNGENLQYLIKYNPARAKYIFENLDPDSTAELILFLILISPDDAKWDNIIVIEFKNSKNETKFKLKLIDTDRSMVKQGIREKDKRTKVKAAPFCLDSARLKLPPLIEAAFLKHNPELFLCNWMEQLIQRKLRYADLFTLTDRKNLIASSKHRPSSIPILFPRRALIEMYQRFIRIQRALQASSNHTLLELLNLADPRTGQRYKDAFNSAPVQTPDGRFEYLAKELYGKSKEGYYTTLQNAQQFSETLGIPLAALSGEIDGFGPDDALREFKEALKEEQHIARVQSEFESGNVESILALTLDSTREQVIARIDFSRLPVERQKSLLKTISTEIAFSRLVLVGCSVLTDQLLFDFFEHSPFLQHFELQRTQGSKISDACFVRLSERCRHLQTLILIDVATIKLLQDGNSIKQKPLVSPELRRLTAKQLPQLSSTLLDAPELQVLEVEQCPVWQTVSITSKKITTLRIKSCAAISALSLEPILSANSLEVMDLSQSPQLSHQQLLRGQLEKEKCSKGLIDPLVHGDRLDISGYFMTASAIKAIANIYPDLTTVVMREVKEDPLRLSVAIMTFMNKVKRIDHAISYLDRCLLLRQFRFELYQQANTITCRLLTPPNQPPLPVDRFKTALESLVPDMRITQTTDFSKSPVLHLIINDENLRFSLFLFLLTARPTKVEIDRMPDNLSTVDIELFVKFNPKVTSLDIRNRKNVETAEATSLLAALPDLEHLSVGGDFSSYIFTTDSNMFSHPDGTLEALGENPTNDPANDLNGEMLCFSETKFLIIPKGSGMLPVCDSSIGEAIHTLEGHTKQVNSAIILPNGSLVTGSEDGTIRKWDLTHRRCLFILQATVLGKQQLLYHPSGKIITLDNGTVLKIWDANTGKPIHTLQTSHTQWNKSSLHLLRDGTVLSACSDKLEVWEITSGKRLKSMECKHTNFPVVVLPDERVARILIFYDQLGTLQDKKLGSITLEIDDLHTGVPQRFADIPFDYLQSVVDKGETLEKRCTLTLLPNGKILFSRIPAIPPANNLRQTSQKDMYLLFSTENDANNRYPFILHNSTPSDTNPYSHFLLTNSELIFCSKSYSLYLLNLLTNSFEKRAMTLGQYAQGWLEENEGIYTRACLLMNGEIINLGYLIENETSWHSRRFVNYFQVLKPNSPAITLSLDSLSKKLTANTTVLLSIDRITIDELDNPDATIIKLLAQIFYCEETKCKILGNQIEILTEDLKKQTQINNFIQSLLNRVVFEKGANRSIWDDEASDISSSQQFILRHSSLLSSSRSNNDRRQNRPINPTTDIKSFQFQP